MSDLQAEAKEVVRILRAFGDEVADVAAVTESDPTPLLHTISFRPTNPEAAKVSVVIFDKRADVFVGAAGLWEVNNDQADRPMLRELLDVTVAGRVEERSFLLGTTCKVSFADGGRHSSTKFGIHLRKRFIRRYQAWRLPAATD